MVQPQVPSATSRLRRLISYKAAFWGYYNSLLVTTHYNTVTLQFSATLSGYNTLRHSTTHCNTLQHTVTLLNTLRLQHSQTTTRCSCHGAAEKPWPQWANADVSCCLSLPPDSCVPAQDCLQIRAALASLWVGQHPESKRAREQLYEPRHYFLTDWHHLPVWARHNTTLSTTLTTTPSTLDRVDLEIIWEWFAHIMWQNFVLCQEKRIKKISRWYYSHHSGESQGTTKRGWGEFCEPRHKRVAKIAGNFLQKSHKLSVSFVENDLGR